MREFLLEITSRNPTNERFNGNDLIRYNLIRKDKFNPTVLAHQFLIQKLIDFAFSCFFQTENNYFSLYDFDFVPKQTLEFRELAGISKKDFAEILESLHIHFLNSEFVYKQGVLQRSPSKLNLKESGSVYTQSEVAHAITLQTLEHKIAEKETLKGIKVLDFGCGTGRFYWAAFRLLNEQFGLSKSEIVTHLYAIDSNEIALSILKLSVLFELGIEYLEVINERIIQRNMLMVKSGLISQDNDYLDLQQDFRSALDTGGFDVIVSNPPYFLLKINQNNSKEAFYKRHYEMLAEKINAELQYFRGAGIYQYSTEGMLNYYKLSIEMMLRLAKPNGELGIICPSTLFGDVSSAKLRKFILGQNRLRKLEFFEEKAKLFDNVSQATTIFYLSKGQKTTDIEVKVSDNSFNISYHLIKDAFPTNMEIPQMEEIGWGILKKLNNFKKLKSYKGLRNRRGEFDLLLFKHLITEQETGFRLVRGNMISSTQIDYAKQQEFVKIEEFKKAKSAEFLQHDFQKTRLVCQQISNVDMARRLKFVQCSAHDVLANSCNYISLHDNSQLENLHTLLNTYLLNWRFKVTSTNNHINNYELDELPLIDYSRFSATVNGNELKNNVEIAREYGLVKHEILYILQPFFAKSEIEHYL